MAIKQASAFVENKPGTLIKVVKKIADEGINVRAMSLADTKDFGILRLIVADTDKIKDVIGDESIVVLNDVIVAKMSDEAGSLYKVLKVLEEVNIEYMYAFPADSSFGAYTVLRVDNVEVAEKLLNENGIATLDQADI